MFEKGFPEYIQACAQLYQVMMSYSLAILVLSFAFHFWRGTVDMFSTLRFLVLLFLIILLSSQAHQFINSGQSTVDEVIAKSGLVRPDHLAEDYKSRLAKTVGDSDLKDESAWHLVVSGHLFDAIIYAILSLISWVCFSIISFISLIQQMALFICWAVCPVLFACMAVPPIARLGSAHLMRIIAIICWPLGFAVASTFSTGLLQLLLNDKYLNQINGLVRFIEIMLILAVVGMWSVVSSIVAPIFIHHFLVGDFGAASVVASGGAARAVRAVPATAKAVWKGASSAVGKGRELFSKSNRTGPTSPTPPPAPPFPANKQLMLPAPPAKPPGLPDPNGDDRLRKLLE